VGKFSYVLEFLNSNTHSSDLLVMDPNVDGAREVVSFCNSTPLNGQFRYVIINDADRLLEPAQDALLKILEEPNDSTKIILVSQDIGHLQSSLSSRLRYIIKWSPLTRSEMVEYANNISSVICEPLLDISYGLPGLYKTMVETPGFEEFLDIIKRIVFSGSNPFFSSAPNLIRDLKGTSNIRDAIVHSINRISRGSTDLRRNVEMLKFANNICRYPSINAEIHWMRMSANLLDVK